MVFWNRRSCAVLWRSAGVLLLAGMVVPAHAQQATRESLSLAAALERAVTHHPALAVFDPRRRIAAGQELQAGLRSNPTLDATFEDFAGTGVERGLDNLQTTLSLSQLILLGHKLERRIAVAGAAGGVVEADHAVARLDVLAETARRYTDVAEAQARLGVAQAALDLARETVAAVRKRVEAGAASPAEASRAAVAVTRAEIDAQGAASGLDAKRIALASMWGAAGADFATVAGDLADLPALRPFAAFSQAALAGPRVARFGAATRLREAELRLARAEAVPDLTVSAGIRRLEHRATGRTPDYGLVAGLSVPLPFFDQRQGEIAAAAARIDATTAERQAEVLRIRTVLYGLYRADERARARAAKLVDAAIPQAGKALAQVRQGYATGRFSFLDWLDAQRQLNGLRAEAVAAQADAHRLDAELERLSAEPVVSVSTQDQASGAIPQTEIPE